ncbi:CobW family GTP-binding protein [Mangrovibacterium lignilyticum]|uniref:CobW family GTP-binding protein n=1 Tax=Mangrovibacterium lignilyticum TaxID=2668052 RepID=UPI0013D73F78|nr:GTP-binding protein [Mangrovibacterium lignilyticum]
MSIPLQLITGFLGSGKTSFLKHYWPYLSQSKKVAVIQNEFSPVNIDGQELKADFSCEMLEVNNGSVFCVCLLGSFIDSLRQFVDQVKPDLLLMEASGLSDTLGVGQVFQSEKLRGKIYLDKVWCLVDAKHFDRAPALKLRLEHQVRSADIVLLNKLDLYDGDLNELKTDIQKMNPFSALVEARHGQIEDYELSGKPRFFMVEQAIGGRPDVESVVIKSAQSISEKALRSFVQNLNGACFRAKGFVRLENGKQGFMQAVFDQLEIKELDQQAGSTELVLIGQFDKSVNLQLKYDEYCRL